MVDQVAGARARRRIALPGTILGIGLGGFVDGLRMNTLWDGFFHAFTWPAVPAGRAGPGQGWWDAGFLILGMVLIFGGRLPQHMGEVIDLCRTTT
ncbi:MAG: hypothetical protein HOW71_10570 [Nonomuraea sp.]|nr:hypothetical protein [Nonomuraea sp.]NUP62604.1 hypothetical protein [Nonomuraea sp.]NUS01039.1 hypothetical protein [Nonomuraea sp.]